MKLQYLALFNLVSLLTVSCQRGEVVEPLSPGSVEEITPSAVVKNTADPSKKSAKQEETATIKSGSFIKGERPTQGTASVITENGKRYLELSQTFKTNQGPDLTVILHRANTLPISGLKEKDYVLLGSLQKLSGAQRYVIPENLNPADFRSAAIWCRKFNATFGYAKFGS